MKTRCEADIVRSLQTVVARAGSLAESNVFTENPGYLRVELEQLRAVTPAQVGAALERYVLSAPAVVLATVPADGTAAAPSPRPRPQAVTESAPLPTSSVSGVIQAGQLDRSQAPESAPLQFSSSPPVRTVQLANGAQSGCAEFSRAPWCALSLALPMGRRAEPRASGPPTPVHHSPLI
jgi:zinc protease